MDRENRWKGKEPITEEIDAMGIMCSKVNNKEAPPVWVPQFFSQFTAAGTMYNMQFGNAPQTLLEIDINPPQTSLEAINLELLDNHQAVPRNSMATDSIQIQYDNNNTYFFNTEQEYVAKVDSKSCKTQYRFFNTWLQLKKSI
ncbi:hypothetical protein Dimus_004333 [Dionaea muscipula]